MKHIDIVNLVLGIALLFQLYQPTSDLIPLLTVENPPRHLHAPQAAEYTLQEKLIKVGPYVNVEDLIRHLESNPASLDDDPKIREHVQKMQQVQQSLLQTEEELLETEAQLNRVALKMYQQLTPAQQRQLSNQRNLDSVQKIEAEYWNDLIQQLEE